MAELVISYVMRHVRHQTVTELCGRFRDWEHFDLFKDLEEERGWKVLSHTLIKAEPATDDS